MAASRAQQRLIESCYPREQLQTATPLRRLTGKAIDGAIPFVSLFLAWQVSAVFEDEWPTEQRIEAVDALLTSTEIVVFFVALLAWPIWFAIVARYGQTPGKQLLGMYVMREDGSRAGGWYTALREIVLQGVLFGFLLGGVTFGIGWMIAALWCTWDRERQCLWDKVGSTYVAWTPAGSFDWSAGKYRFRPLTAAEYERSGQQPPARHEVPEELRPVEAQPDTEAPRESGVSARLRELQRLRDEGLITAEQFEQRRAAILEEL